MTQDEADSLKSCNGMGYIGDGQWLPYRKDGDSYYTLDGLKAWAPYRWRSLTYPEIVAEMNSHNEVPLTVMALNRTALS